MKNLLFSGYYGHQNTGDDAFIEVAAWGAKKYWHCGNSKFITQNLPIIQNHADLVGKNYFKGNYFLKSTIATISADAFICAGGSTFHSPINDLDPINIARLKKKYFQKFKIGAIGVSLGPYRSIVAEKENINLLRKFDFLALRDKESYKMAMEYNLPYEPIEAFDLAALLPKIYGNISKDEIPFQKNILGISICNYESYLKNGDLKNEARRNEQIENLLFKIAGLNQKTVFRFFIFNGNKNIGDKKATLALVSKLKSIKSFVCEIVDYDPNTYNTWLKIQECNLVISTRLHAAVFACFANVPFFLVEYHRKCSDFLNNIGYQNNYRIFDADFEVNKFALKIIELLAEKQPYIKPTNIDKAVDKAEYNFTKIKIHGG
ncbi:MAG: polysaccharide pyruvyl transferase family protein [Lentimicrobium sp.]|jgi:polysaccharide pyruvyl transferase WcaK-like protein|nr:polysaccharide pyruvyl transferase family protein [Lentimicrobium sp.]